MTKEASKSQIDLLGRRLKEGALSEADLRLLDSYRRSFSEPYKFVVGKVREDLGLAPTGRPAKSTTSIIDKLRRESIRLTQIQDIAGCRLIVADIAAQESVVQSLKDLFAHTTVIDRREKPSHGYRAVHVVVKSGDKMIEVQVRTALQHLWAELSEKYSDVYGPEIKYGGGDEEIQSLLGETSETVATAELAERRLAIADVKFSEQKDIAENVRQKYTELRGDIVFARGRLFQMLREHIDMMAEDKGESDDISD